MELDKIYDFDVDDLLDDEDLSGFGRAFRQIIKPVAAQAGRPVAKRTIRPAVMPVGWRPPLTTPVAPRPKGKRKVVLPSITPAVQAVCPEVKEPQYASGREGFLQWLRWWQPAIHQRIAVARPELVYADQRKRQAKRDFDFESDALDYEGYNYDTGNFLLYGVGEPPETPQQKQTWADRITSVLTPLMQAYQQKQIFKIQLKRAEEGLPPLKTDDLAAQVKVKVEAGKELTQTLTQFLLPIGLGIGALLVVPLLFRRRR